MHEMGTGSETALELRVEQLTLLTYGHLDMERRGIPAATAAETSDRLGALHAAPYTNERGIDASERNRGIERCVEKLGGYGGAPLLAQASAFLSRLDDALLDTATVLEARTLNHLAISYGVTDMDGLFFALDNNHALVQGKELAGRSLPGRYESYVALDRKMREVVSSNSYFLNTAMSVPYRPGSESS